MDVFADFLVDKAFFLEDKIENFKENMRKRFYSKEWLEFKEKCDELNKEFQKLDIYPTLSHELDILTNPASVIIDGDKRYMKLNESIESKTPKRNKNVKSKPIDRDLK